MIGGGIDAPMVVIMVDGEDVVGQFHCGATRFVEFVDVMGLDHGELVAIAFREFRQLLVEQKHDVHPNAEVGCMEKALTFGKTAFFDFLEMILPSCGAHNNGQMQVEAAVDVTHHLVGLAEIDGNVGSLELFDALFPFLRIVDGNHNFVLVGDGSFLHLVAHLSVSDDCNFHVCVGCWVLRQAQEPVAVVELVETPRFILGLT